MCQQRVRTVHNIILACLLFALACLVLILSCIVLFSHRVYCPVLSFLSCHFMVCYCLFSSYLVLLIATFWCCLSCPSQHSPFVALYLGMLSYIIVRQLRERMGRCRIKAPNFLQVLRSLAIILRPAPSDLRSQKLLWAIFVITGNCRLQKSWKKADSLVSS